jgi:outer membrane protein assembly factor BamD
MVLAVGNRPVRALRLFGFGAVAVLLAGCSTASVIKDVFGNDSTPAASTSMGLTGGAMSPGNDAPGRGDPVAELYNSGLEKLKSGSYKAAAKSFSEVERQHPYSKWATKALLMQAFAYYQSNKYDDAINAANRFITLHPGHKDSAYAYYLTAISQYEQISDVRRDQSRTQKALDALEEVNKRFPASPYAADAVKKAAVARDQLAAKEMEVGRYYLKKGSYLAGINRFKKVVSDYQTTSQVPEALYRLTEGYMALGVVSEAQTAAAVLGQNFPNSEWYKDAYTLVSSDGQQPVENKKSWISRLFNG